MILLHNPHYQISIFFFLRLNSVFNRWSKSVFNSCHMIFFLLSRCIYLFSFTCEFWKSHWVELNKCNRACKESLPRKQFASTRLLDPYLFWNASYSIFSCCVIIPTPTQYTVIIVNFWHHVGKTSLLLVNVPQSIYTKKIPITSNT